MRTISTTCAIALLALAAAPHVALAGPFGLGIAAGEPTGLSAKYWTGRSQALDWGLAWSFEGKDAFHVHMDYLWHAFRIFEVEDGSMPLYYGLGGRIKFVEGHDDLLGVRIPVGVAYIFPSRKVDLFLEAVPVFDLTPDTDLSMNAAIGVRYFFPSRRATARTGV